MARKRKKRKRRKKGECYFCKANIEPDYKDFSVLRRFVTDQGKISSGLDTGVCAKHQRKLSQMIKRARFLALMPYV